MKCYECWWALCCREDSRVFIIAESFDRALVKWDEWADAHRQQQRVDGAFANVKPDLQVIRELFADIVMT